MAVEIDDLQVRITANAQKATSALKSLSSELKKVKSENAALSRTLSGSAISGGGSARVRQSTEGVKKLGNEIENAGKKAKKADGIFSRLGKSLFRIAVYRAIRSAMKAVTEAFDEGLKSAYGYSKQSENFKRLADSLDHLKSITSQMVNQLGAFWGEIKQFIMPAVDWIVEKVRYLAEKATELFAALNGADYYQYARLVAVEWDDATEALKQYKHQLLGLDELNNLSKREGNGKDDVDYTEKYYRKLVNPNLRGLGTAWGKIKETISKNLDDIDRLVIGAEIGMGAVLLLSGANIPLGLGLLAHGTWRGIKRIKEDWENINLTVDEKLARLGEIVGGAMAGIGAVLAFSGANIPLGLGLIVGGASIFAASEAKLKWDKLDNKTKKTIETVTATASAALLAIGAVLTFSGANIPLGLGMMGLGAVGLAAEKQWNGKSIIENLESAWKNIKSWWNSTVVVAVEKAIGWIEEQLNFDINGDGKIGYQASKKAEIFEDSFAKSVRMGYISPITVNPGSKGTTGAAAMNDLSEAIRKGNINPVIGNKPGLSINTPTETTTSTKSEPSILQKAWNSNNFVNTLGSELGIKARNGVEKLVVDTINDTKKFIDDVGNSIKNSDMYQSIAEDFFGVYKPGSHGSKTKGFAVGGVPQMGSLFYAGEAGAEFVGNIGSTSAVANTGQMTEAIYKAAYMGMSKALKENGGGGMNGFEPATTDDLFIAMRKKASNYNKMTGNSAFA